MPSTGRVRLARKDDTHDDIIRNPFPPGNGGGCSVCAPTETARPEGATMSAAAIFVPGAASRWDPLPEEIKALPRRLRVVATEVWWAIVDHLERGLDATTEAITDAVLSQHSGWSRSFIQHGLNILEYMARVIVRKRQHGRRIIRVIIRLWGSRNRQIVPPSGSPSTPPQTPPEGFERTTKDTGSSSSLEKLPEKTPEPDDPAIADLVARACALVPDATVGRVAAAVRTYGADWVRRALGVAEERNRTCRSQSRHPVKKWRYILGILENWRTGGGPPPEESPAPPPAPKPAAEPEAPQPLTAEEVAALVAACSQAGYIGKWNRKMLGVRIRSGLISSELVATIPPEILSAPEVTAGISG
jgi:hypothetical protein